MIPLQQCVDYRREVSHETTEESWYRHADSFLGFQLTGIVPNQTKLIESARTEVVECNPIPENLVSTLSISMRLVAPAYVV